MLGVDPEFGTSVLRLWLAAGSAALLILFCTLALFQPQLRVALTPARRVGVVIVGAVLGAVIMWSSAARPVSGDRGAERRSFELRVEELSARTLAPGSPLACLDGLAGDSVEAACEKALFASPTSVAAASSYVAAKFALLSSMTSYASRGDADVDDLISPLRRSLEADRFGFVAHILAVRYGCTSQSCKALAPLRDASQVRKNLNAATLDHYLEHYVALWSTAPDGGLADATPSPGATAPSSAPGQRKTVNIDFPTAASIPAVSIMNPEPSGPVLPGVASAAASNPQGTAPSTHHRKQAANPPASSPAQSAASTSGAVEPIWPEPMPSPPPSSPQTTAAPAVTAPVQLNPPSTASAGAPARTQ